MNLLDKMQEMHLPPSDFQASEPFPHHFNWKGGQVFLSVEDAAIGIPLLPYKACKGNQRERRIASASQLETGEARVPPGMKIRKTMDQMTQRTRAHNDQDADLVIDEVQRSYMTADQKTQSNTDPFLFQEILREALFHVGPPQGRIPRQILEDEQVVMVSFTLLMFTVHECVTGPERRRCNLALRGARWCNQAPAEAQPASIGARGANSKPLQKQSWAMSKAEGRKAGGRIAQSRFCLGCCHIETLAMPAWHS